MPLETARSRTLQAPELVLPPPFSAVRLREVGDAFAHAISLAAERGAGTLVYVGRFDLAEFAVVLEPDEPLLKARRAFYAGMAALADALAVHAQPGNVYRHRLAGFTSRQSRPRRRAAGSLGRTMPTKTKRRRGWYSAE
jgi:hypothetical protein